MRSRFTAVALLAVLAAGCGDSTGITPDKLAGTWTATTYRFTNPANAADTVDLVALGATLTIVIRADSTFTLTTRDQAGAVETSTGTLMATGNVLTIAESGQGSPTPFTAVRDGDTLTLTSASEEWDFDGDGTEEPAMVTVVLHRS